MICNRIQSGVLHFIDVKLSLESSFAQLNQSADRSNVVVTLVTKSSALSVKYCKIIQTVIM